MARVILPLLFGLVGAAILAWLGTWQMQRLNWKATVLSEIDARIAAPPVAVPQSPDPVVDRFLPVVAQGAFTNQELHVLVSVKLVGPGYRIIAPFVTSDGRRIMVDRGFIRTPHKDTPRAPHAARLFGNLHWPNEIDSFTPENDPVKNTWYSRDVATMSTALKTEPVLLILRETSETDPLVTPLPVTSRGIPNDHLQYAVTWYGLAIVWLAMTLYYLRRMRKDKKVLSS